MDRIGLLGVGRMGRAIGERILAAGFPLLVHNRTAARADALIAQGAQWVATPDALPAQTDIILTMLTDDTAVEMVYAQLLTGDCANRVFVEMSTIRTTTIDRLRPQVEAAGARLVDCPVSGTVEPARNGQLIGLVGGSAEDVARVRPLLTSFCRRIEHLGPSGAGTTGKVVVNMPMAIYWAALAEALAIGAQRGLDLAQLLDVILDSPVALPALRAKVPLLLGAPHEVAFDVTGVRKDLLAFTATALDHGVPAPTGAAALAHFAAATAAGYGARDLAFITAYLAEVARTTAPQEPSA